MDIFQTVSGYITKMVSAGDSAQSQAAARMKILLLDNETVCEMALAMQRSRSHVYLGAYCFLSHYPVRPAQLQCLPHRSP